MVTLAGERVYDSALDGPDSRPAPRQGRTLAKAKDSKKASKDEEEFADDEEMDEEIDDELDDDEVDPDADAEGDDDGDDDDDEEAAVPARRKGAGSDEEEDDDEDPDDVEADLDTILKDRIASGEDLDEDEEEETKDTKKKTEADPPEGVTAKREGEFTCNTCFMIVHPRQFGSRSQLTCPEGYDDCAAIARIKKMRK